MACSVAEGIRPGPTRGALALLALGALVLFACGGPPVGVKRMDPIAVQRELTRSAVSSDDLSTATQNVLFRRNLRQRYADDPAGAIAELHRMVASGQGSRDDLSALAEVSFDHAERTGDQRYHRSAAVYAWMFLFPQDGSPLDPLDPRSRLAADIYNLGLARGFASGPNGDFVPQQGSYEVPFGHLDVYFDESRLVWGSRRLTRFVPVAELGVTGLETRYRWPGIGAPLAASTEPLDKTKGFNDFIQPWIKVPLTALLRMDDVAQQLPAGRVAGFLTLERALVQASTEVNGKQVPLESESTADWAYMLAESPVWQRELGGFLQRIGGIEKGTQLASLGPYRPGRIPIVFVHGTASSPGRWAEMINELANDPRVGSRFQAWLFTYDTGNPIVYSAMLLRKSLDDAVARLDPQGKDPSLRDMVVIGHSQGGLLTKMTAIDSGSRFWDLASSRPIDELDISDEDRKLMHDMAFVKPVPEVKRVIFLSTPQRGSYIAGNWFAHQFARLIVMPASIMRIGTDVVTRNRSKFRSEFTGLNTSVYGMTPGSPFIKTLAQIPLAPGVKAHSIIAVKDPDVPLDKADDGVVEYSSAHIDGVESELVVTSGHSCQQNPVAIEEVKRILLEHVTEYDAQQAGGAAGPRSLP